MSVPKPGQMNAEGVTGIETAACLECGHKFNAIGPIDCAPSMPAPGDVVLCIRCGAAQTYEAGKLRGFTDAEMDALMADTEYMNDLAKHVQRIHFLRAGLN